MQSVSRKREKLVNLIERIRFYNEKFFANQNRVLIHQKSLVRLMSPVNILKKGFAIVKRNGKIVIDPQDINVDEDLTVVLQNTDIETTVKRKMPGDGKFDI